MGVGVACNDVGFVLKRFLPIKQKISVLTACTGKIQLVTDPLSIGHKLWPGMLIEGVFRSTSNTIFWGTGIEVISFPSAILLQNITWYHQLLEICYYFVPLASPCQEVYVALGVVPLLLEYKQNSANLLPIKQICTIYLLSKIGMHHPSDCNQVMAVVNDIAWGFAQNKTTDYAYLGHLLEKELRGIVVGELENWIYSCLKQHPCFKVFKANNLELQSFVSKG